MAGGGGVRVDGYARAGNGAGGYAGAVAAWVSAGTVRAFRTAGIDQRRWTVCDADGGRVSPDMARARRGVLAAGVSRTGCAGASLPRVGGRLLGVVARAPDDADARLRAFEASCASCGTRIGSGLNAAPIRSVVGVAFGITVRIVHREGAPEGAVRPHHRVAVRVCQRQALLKVSWQFGKVTLFREKSLHR